MSNPPRSPSRTLTLHVRPRPPDGSPSKQTDTIQALLYEPPSPQISRGGIVVIQEIFGVNSHIRSVAARYADLGYTVLAPAFFDHLQPGTELGYNDRDFVRGRDLVSRLGWETAVADVEAAALELKRLLPEDARVGAIGFCWGGSLAFLASTRLPSGTLAAAVSYYGRHAPEFRDEIPRCPVLFHFGEFDPMIPMESVQLLRESRVEQTFFVYPSGHGFNCDQRPDFDPASARLAEERTLEFLATRLRQATKIAPEN